MHQMGWNDEVVRDSRVRNKRLLEQPAIVRNLKDQAVVDRKSVTTSKAGTARNT